MIDNKDQDLQGIHQEQTMSSLEELTKRHFGLLEEVESPVNGIITYWWQKNRVDVMRGEPICDIQDLEELWEAPFLISAPAGGTLNIPKELLEVEVPYVHKGEVVAFIEVKDPIPI